MRFLTRLLFMFTASLFLFAGAAGAFAQPLALPSYVAGEHYQILPNPVKLAPEDKIEVMEVFWYGCSHCLAFEPLVGAWKKSLADDVEFVRTPAIWGRKNTPTHSAMQAHAVLYYITEGLDLPESIHTEIFQLVVKTPRQSDPEKFAEIFARHGVDKDEFLSKFESFGLRAKVNKAEKRLGNNYLTQGTPEMVVNGRYRVSARMAGGQKEMLDVVNFLVDEDRKLMPLPTAGEPGTDSAS